MQALLGIKDFGKIKSAEVDLNGFSVFVGNNNSGKTYVMQLVYGVLQNLRSFIYQRQSTHLKRLEEQAENGRVILDAESITDIENYFNEILEEEKEKIVSDTFHEKIGIGRLYLRLFMEEDEQIEILLWNYGRQAHQWNDSRQDYQWNGGKRAGLLDEIMCQLNDEAKKAWQPMLNGLKDFLMEKIPFRVLLQNYKTNENKKNQRMRLYLTEQFTDFILVMNMVLEVFLEKSSKMLFLPAARTGLLMLYKEFFANKADEAVKAFNADDFLDMESSADKADAAVKAIKAVKAFKAGEMSYLESSARKMGLTQPVYDFLRFIQTFVPEKQLSEEMTGLRQYIETHLIDGKITIGGGSQAVYQPQNTKCGLPLYLTSSMVNELAPIFYALQSAERPRRIIWDEIETSLHPQKQMELARLLSRMSNAGFSMIVSTHSDTMAAKINNLCLLSFSQSLNGKREEILKQAGLEEADLFKDKIHVYQFENDKEGNSSSQELEYDELTGYQFPLFNDSIEKLLQETRLIME